MMAVKKTRWLIIGLYAFLALVVFSPLSSDRYVPYGDCVNHLSWMMQARTALIEFQFPLRVAPIINNRLGYPEFQFYAPFPFTLAGILLLPHFAINPFVIYKLLLRMSLVIGGFYMFRLSQLLTQSISASALAGAAYLLSPYLIINATLRQDFTECFAQSLLPIILFYSFKLFEKPTEKKFIIASLCWSMLILTHLLTFAYSTIFLMLFFFLQCGLQKDKRWVHFFYFLLAILFACLLCAWFLGPIITFSKHFFIHNDLNDPYDYRWLTPLAGLFSLSSVSPMPLPGNGLLQIALYPAVGYPVLIAIGLLFYIYWCDKAWIYRNKSIQALMICFCIAVFMAWSPIDFWRWLPPMVVILQFTYRMLTQLMWVGALLFAFSLAWLFKRRWDECIFMTILVLIILGNRSWLHTVASNTEYPQSPRDAALLFAESSDRNFTVRPETLTASETLAMDHPIPISSCHRQKSWRICDVSVTHNNEPVVLPLLYYPHMLSIQIDHRQIPYYATADGDRVYAALKLKPGHYQIQMKFSGLDWANYLSAVTWFVLIGFIAYRKMEKKHV